MSDWPASISLATLINLKLETWSERVARTYTYLYIIMIIIIIIIVIIIIIIIIINIFIYILRPSVVSEVSMFFVCTPSGHLFSENWAKRGEETYINSLN